MIKYMKLHGNGSLMDCARRKKMQVNELNKATFSAYEGIFEILEYGKVAPLLETELKCGIMLLYVTSGVWYIRTADYEKRLLKGECAVLMMGRGYTLQGENSECNAEYAVFEGSFVYDLMRLYEISDLTSALAPDALEALEDICERMDNGKISDKLGDIATAFHRLMFKLNRACRASGDEKSLAYEMKKYIDTHLEGKITLEILARSFFVSKTQLFRSFKASYGVAPMQYCLQKKIELAKSMLSDGKLKISEIAESLSFTDAKHFTKTFKRLTGELPKNYRRRLCKQA